MSNQQTSNAAVTASGAVVTFVLSVLMFRELLDYLSTKGMPIERATWWSLLVIVSLGAAAGVGSYLLVFRQLLEKGIGQVWGSLKTITAGKVAIPTLDQDQVAPEDSRDQVVDKLRRAAAPIVPLVQDGKLTGVISAEDLSKPGASAQVIASSVPVTVAADDTLDTAYRRMLTSGHSALPVLDASGKPIGTLKLSQIVQQLEEARLR